MGVEKAPRRVRTSVPCRILGELASAATRWVLAGALLSTLMPEPAGSAGPAVTGRPPRPAIRAIRTMSYCATRSDCCMSATLVCTRVSRLLKSNSRRMPRTTTTVTARATRSSTRVKPAWLAGRAARARRELIASSSIRLENRQGDLLANAQGTAGTPALQRDLDLLGMDEGRWSPSGEGVGHGAAGQHAGEVVLADGDGARPQRHVRHRTRADDGRNPGLIHLREIAHRHRRRSRRNLEVRTVERQRIEAF